MCANSRYRYTKYHHFLLWMKRKMEIRRFLRVWSYINTCVSHGWLLLFTKRLQINEIHLMSTRVISNSLLLYDFEQIIIHSQTDKINRKNKQTEFINCWHCLEVLALFSGMNLSNHTKHDYWWLVTMFSFYSSDAWIS